MGKQAVTSKASKPPSLSRWQAKAAPLGKLPHPSGKLGPAGKLDAFVADVLAETWRTVDPRFHPFRFQPSKAATRSKPPRRQAGKLAAGQAGQASQPSGPKPEQAAAPVKVDRRMEKAAPGGWWTVLAWDGAKCARGPWPTREQAEKARERAIKADPSCHALLHTMLACYRTREQARWAEVSDPFGEESGRLIIRAS